MSVEMLEVVDENDNVIGLASRQDMHGKGLRHRETGVLFVTPNADIIFQRRSMLKDTFPGRLDATAAGHVEIGDSYQDTAIKEIKEETGLTVDPSDFIFLGKDFVIHEDVPANVFNHRFVTIYGYIFHGSINDLTIEEGKADGFEAFHGPSILQMPHDQQLQFPLMDSEFGQSIYRTLIKRAK